MPIDDSVCSNRSDQFFCLLLCSWNGMEIWIRVRMTSLKWWANRKLLVLHCENLFHSREMWIVGHYYQYFMKSHPTESIVFRSIYICLFIYHGEQRIVVHRYAFDELGRLPFRFSCSTWSIFPCWINYLCERCAMQLSWIVRRTLSLWTYGNCIIMPSHCECILQFSILFQANEAMPEWVVVLVCRRACSKESRQHFPLTNYLHLTSLMTVFGTRDETITMNGEIKANRENEQTTVEFMEIVVDWIWRHFR